MPFEVVVPPVAILLPRPLLTGVLCGIRAGGCVELVHSVANPIRSVSVAAIVGTTTSHGSNPLRSSLPSHYTYVMHTSTPISSRLTTSQWRMSTTTIRRRMPISLGDEMVTRRIVLPNEIIHMGVYN